MRSATCNGHEEAVKSLLAAGANISNPGAKSTALIEACASGYANVATVLLRAGPKFDAPKGTYVTPLVAACFCCRARVVELLLDEGADINAPADNFSVALQVAICRFDSELVDLLYNKGPMYKEEDIDCGVRAWAEAMLTFIRYRVSDSDREHMRSVLEARLHGLQAWQEALLIFINRFCHGDEDDARYVLEHWGHEA